MHEFVLGGARSGKSRYAQQRAMASGLSVIYIATATAGDAEMQRRIDMHRQTRPENWTTHEESLVLGAVLNQYDSVNNFIIVDCLTLWLSNLLAQSETILEEQISEFFTAVQMLKASAVFVSNEVGMGIVPLGELSRRFVDEAGRVHQRLAGECQRVTQMIAGIPNVIKTANE